MVRSFKTRLDQSVPCKTNPLGVKGVGELGTIGATPAVVNAVVDAVWRHGSPEAALAMQMPLTAEDVQNVLFQTSKKRNAGYDEDEVDAFLDQVAAELTKQGAGSTVGGLLALGLSREMAPLLTATLLTGKVATAYAAELGTMKVTEQIDAITMLRTDPVQFLVVPRILAMVLMAPVQCLLFFFVGIWSGQLSSTWLYNIPPSVFWNSVRTWMEPSDLPAMLLKAVVFGLQIAVIACGWGLSTKGGPKEVGTSTTGAVVMILVTVALMDALLTKLLFD
jgi:phospholipid/cholesterol/gamma-HCH transport system permease protein